MMLMMPMMAIMMMMTTMMMMMTMKMIMTMMMTTIAKVNLPKTLSSAPGWTWASS